MDYYFCQVLIPAAGHSERFKEKTPLPKGLVDMKYRGRVAPMLSHIISALPTTWEVDVGIRRVDATAFINKFSRSQSTRIFSIGDDTSGQAETVLRMINHSVQSMPDFLVVNSDNVIRGLNVALSWWRQHKAEAGAVVFDDPDWGAIGKSKYGYVDNLPQFNRGAEKSRLSRFALAGAFYFKSKDIYREAYAAASAPQYISALFEHIGGLKLASWIDRKTMLKEWGTWQDLENDKEVEIDWSENQA